MRDKVLNFIRENRLLEAGDNVLLGVSGGADSTCLLHVLKSLSGTLSVQLAVLHVNHGLRGKEAEEDEAFVRSLCKAVHIPFFSEKADIKAEAKVRKESEETTGRQVRYEMLKKCAKVWGADKIAVAHNENDNAETMLFQLFRGSGLKGLSGISPMRGNIIRPLLGCTRIEIENYLAKENQPYRTDYTNYENLYTRNKIRNQILTLVTEEINPLAVQNMSQTAKLLREMDAYFEKQAEEYIKSCMKQEVCGRKLHKEPLAAPEIDKICLPIDSFQALESPIKQYVIRSGVFAITGSIKDLTARHVLSTIECMEKPVGKTIALPGNIQVKKAYNHLIIEKKTEGDTDNTGGIEDKYNISFQVIPKTSDLEIPEKKYTKWFDYDRIRKIPNFRNRKTGDYIHILPRGQKTVKQFMIDEKIPREERDRIPVLADGSHILWIVGYRISEACKVTQKTKNILQVSIQPKGRGDYNGHKDKSIAE